ncbi:hypothetical protein ACFSTC_25570 [Nonomuraea ferruginea]
MTRLLGGPRMAAEPASGQDGACLTDTVSARWRAQPQAGQVLRPDLLVRQRRHRRHLRPGRHHPPRSGRAAAPGGPRPSEAWRRP